jgi:hypothetical protein
MTHNQTQSEDHAKHTAQQINNIVGEHARAEACDTDINIEVYTDTVPCEVLELARSQNFVVFSMTNIDGILNVYLTRHDELQNTAQLQKICHN